MWDFPELRSRRGITLHPVPWAVFLFLRPPKKNVVSCPVGVRENSQSGGREIFLFFLFFFSLNVKDAGITGGKMRKI